MKRLIRFLGGVNFAILLISVTALLVVVGTFLESLTDSHLYSANFIYHHPIFMGLLCGFFINILVSALRRYPFKAKHIGFLTTHLGLLMIILGVMIKSYWGVQGQLFVTEGAATNKLLLADTKAIRIEKRNTLSSLQKTTLDIPFKTLTKQKSRFDDVIMQIVDFSPHAAVNYKTWEENKVFLNHKDWDIVFAHLSNVEDFAKNQFVKDTDIVFVNKETDKIISRISLKEALDKKKAILYWNGVKAIIVQCEDQDVLINLNGKDCLLNECAKLTDFKVDLVTKPKLLVLKDEEEDQHLFAFSKEGEINYQKFINNDLSSVYLYDEGFLGYAVETNFSFHGSENEQLNHKIASLKKILEKNLSSLRDEELIAPLKLIKIAAKESNEEFVTTLLNILLAWDKNPSYLTSDRSGIKPILLALQEYNFNLRELIKLYNDQIVDYESYTLKAESPLSQHVEKQPSLLKWEDNQPLLELEFTKSDKKERLRLIFDKYGQQLAWPIFDGEYLIRFQPQFIEIPYKIRLHSARQINYPGSTQAFSYEADIIVKDIKTGKKQDKTISMNNVHETIDGYRFYLSSITPTDHSTAQKAQIVVNHDPMKYWLIFPGGFFIFLGIIILLFWKKTKVR